MLWVYIERGVYFHITYMDAATNANANMMMLKQQYLALPHFILTLYFKTSVQWLQNIFSSVSVNHTASSSLNLDPLYIMGYGKVSSLQFFFHGLFNP